MTATRKENPPQHSMTLDTPPSKDPSITAMELALEKCGDDMADAREWLRRDIKRHETQFEQESETYKARVKRALAMKPPGDISLIKKPSDPKHKIAVLEEAIGRLG